MYTCIPNHKCTLKKTTKRGTTSPKNILKTCIIASSILILFSRPLAHFQRAGRSPHSWIFCRNGVRPCIHTYMAHSGEYDTHPGNLERRTVHFAYELSRSCPDVSWRILRCPKVSCDDIWPLLGWETPLRSQLQTLVKPWETTLKSMLESY